MTLNTILDSKNVICLGTKAMVNPRGAVSTFQAPRNKKKSCLKHGPSLIQKRVTFYSCTKALKSCLKSSNTIVSRHVTFSSNLQFERVESSDEELIRRAERMKRFRTYANEVKLKADIRSFYSNLLMNTSPDVMEYLNNNNLYKNQNYQSSLQDACNDFYGNHSILSI